MRRTQNFQFETIVILNAQHLLRASEIGARQMAVDNF